MKVLRVFPRRTSYTPRDELAYVGDPPLFRPEVDEVHVSVAFSWDRAEGERLGRAWGNYYPIVKMGGPAYGSACDSFVPGAYVASGYTFSTRGCDFDCPWCMVPGIEGPFRELAEVAPGWCIQDNNILLSSRGHFRRVCEMLRRQRRAARFAGGLDARLLKAWHVELLKGLRLDEVFFAFDENVRLTYLQKVAHMMAWLPRRKLRCYVLIAYEDDSPGMATGRLQAVWDLGFMPFAQYYQGPGEKRRGYRGAEWFELIRMWTRPAAMVSSAKRG